LKDQRKRVAKRLASGLLAGALDLGGLAISGGSVTAKTPTSLTTQRLSGADRYETSVAVARDLIAAGAGAPTGLVIASGTNPYDALAGAVLTTANRPLLLVQKDSIPTSVSNFIADYRTSFRDAAASVVYVLGGESAISAATLTAITSAVTSAGDLTPPTVVRVSGADRYATAKAVSDVAGITVASDRLIIVNGEDGKWADALSAGLLAAENGWPIVLTTSTGLQASAKAKIDSYLALGGSSALFTIVGGTSVVPTAVTDYLVVDSDVPPANITRYSGADRYATNKAVNDAAYSAGVRGLSVALVSGEAPWDALASSAWAAYRNASLLMTPAAGGNLGVATFAVVASVYSYLGFGGNNNLWVIGGSSAVSDVAKLGYVGAATSVNVTSTLTCPDKHSVANFGSSASVPTAILSLSGALGAPEIAAITTEVAGQVKEGTANISSTVSDFNAIGLSNTAGTTFAISLPFATTVGSTISWAGWTEGVAVGAYTPTRTIAGSSCVYTNDTTPPSVTLRAIPSTDGNAGNAASALTTSALRLLLSSDEPITVSGTAPFVSIGALSVTTAATVTDVSAGSGQTQFLIQLSTTGALPPGADLTAGNTITVQASRISDAGSNPPSANPSATIAGDTTGPTFGTPSVSVSAVSNATIARGSLAFTALPDGVGTQFGARGSSWQLAVNNQRGVVLPTVAINATTKTITVTADTGYHTVADVAAAYTATGDGDWSAGISAASGAALTDTVTATVANATVLTTDGVAGVSKVRVRVTASEPVTFATAGLSVQVSQLIAGSITGATSNINTAYAATGTPASFNRRIQYTFSTTSIGTATLNYLGDANGVYDSNGNRSSGSVNFTIS